MRAVKLMYKAGLHSFEQSELHPLGQRYVSREMGHQRCRETLTPDHKSYQGACLACEQDNFMYTEQI